MGIFHFNQKYNRLTNQQEISNKISNHIYLDFNVSSGMQISKNPLNLKLYLLSLHKLLTLQIFLNL